MAIFYWQILSLKKGSATTYSNYIWRRGQWSSREDLVATGFGNLPAWCNGDPVVFWKAADLYERRNGSVCRELVVALPRELNRTEWQALVETLIQRDIGPKPYQFAIHVPREDDREHAHPHAHILYCDRIPDEHERPPEIFFRRFNPGAPELGGCKKDSGGRPLFQLRAEVTERRKEWAEIVNNALTAGGHSARVDHRRAK